MTPIKSNLVALGTAAVVAVYSAGYARTREAAERFAVEDSQRREAHERRAPVASAPEPAVAEAAKDTSTHAVATAHADTTPHAKAHVVDAATPKHSEAKSVERAHPAVVAHADSAPSRAADTAAKPVESPPIVSPPPAVVTPPSPTPTADTTTAEKPLKDGVYSGWGTSRHGDIEATVSIKNGKIAEAFISQCLTQYSCSWVAALPPQVVARQSAEVDYVSGATQSTNAFYYAVIAALKKAK